MKRRIKQLALIGVIGPALLIGVGPFLVPVRPLKGTRPAQALGDADSQFIEINGVSVHVKTRGEGGPVFVLLHGFGASLYSWRPVMEALGRLGTVIAYDRPAFGLTERPLMWDGLNPYSPEAQTALVIGLLDHFGAQQAILVGHSAGGTVAMQTALAHPERVAALILVDPSVGSTGGAPAWTRPLLTSPQMRRLAPLLARRLQAHARKLVAAGWHDPTQLSDETVALYKKPLLAENWDRALWEQTLATPASSLTDQLSEFTLPVLVITGDDDRIVPTAGSARLADKLPGAALAVIAGAGHTPHEEKPEVFMQAVTKFVDTLPH